MRRITNRGNNQFEYRRRKGTKISGTQTQDIHYNIITLFTLTDHSRLRNNVRVVQNARRLITYFIHGRRGLIFGSYIYNYVQFV